MIHRHLAYPDDAAVTALGDAAIDDLLDRGDLHDWQPLAKAIPCATMRANPTSPFGALDRAS
ncbi:MAG: hypothetical protein IPL60_02405 [Ardenticatenia bacterium]|nr:hypothetical protein [Ardenticatenia bacterium]